jgi:hypothetical protein
MVKSIPFQIEKFFELQHFDLDCGTNSESQSQSDTSEKTEESSN